VVPETRELGQLLRMLEERGADTVPCPMIAIRDTPDTAPVVSDFPITTLTASKTQPVSGQVAGFDGATIRGFGMRAQVDW
jgi:hypothetical protein